MKERDLARAAVIAAKLAGCNCEPEIRITEDAWGYRATVHHDAWCDHPSMVAERMCN